VEPDWTVQSGGHPKTMAGGGIGEPASSSLPN